MALDALTALVFRFLSKHAEDLYGDGKYDDAVVLLTDSDHGLIEPKLQSGR
jgi:hypothetical protein